MLSFSGKGILLDLEATIASASVIIDILRPYARARLPVFLRSSWSLPEMARLREEIARLHGAESFEAWTGGAGMPPEQRLVQLKKSLYVLMENNSAAAPLHAIEDMIWRSEYQKGLLRTQLCPDVPKALRHWKQRGIDVRIRSVLNVPLQRLYFAHTNHHRSGKLDLTGFLSGYYDSGFGPATDPETFRRIALDFHLPPGQIIFLGRALTEVDAAQAAGLQTACVRRPPPETAPTADRPEPPVSNGPHPSIASLDGLSLGPAAASPPTSVALK
jgi:enolase-phosphatase E1